MLLKYLSSKTQVGTCPKGKQLFNYSCLPFLLRKKTLTSVWEGVVDWCLNYFFKKSVKN